MTVSWTDAVTDAVRRVAARRSDGMFTRQDLLAEEGDRMVADTGSQGETPEQTISRELQQLRGAGIIEFVDDAGTYRVIG
jgi:putative restriction endonuclease